MGEMTNEEAIKQITMWLYAAPDVPPMQVVQALELAVDALRAGGKDMNVTTMPAGQPLTLEQLRGMANKPYWHVGMREDSAPPHWSILDPLLAYHPEDYDYGKCWIAYAYQPANIDREAWEPCELCKRIGEEDPCYKDQCFKKNAPACDFRCDKFLDWRADTRRLTGAMFCPKCGRPLTEGAWAELEKRVMGVKHYGT